MNIYDKLEKAGITDVLVKIENDHGAGRIHGHRVIMGFTAQEHDDFLDVYAALREPWESRQMVIGVPLDYARRAGWPVEDW